VISIAPIQELELEEALSVYIGVEQDFVLILYAHRFYSSLTMISQK